jgi:hypothetical protein
MDDNLNIQVLVFGASGFFTLTCPRNMPFGQAIAMWNII